jgi:hypothetical protein
VLSVLPKRNVFFLRLAIGRSLRSARPGDLLHAVRTVQLDDASVLRLAVGGSEASVAVSTFHGLYTCDFSDPEADPGAGLDRLPERPLVLPAVRALRLWLRRCSRRNGWQAPCRSSPDSRQCGVEPMRGPGPPAGFPVPLA